MIEILFYVCAALIGAAIGIAIILWTQKISARSQAKTIIEDAQREADVIAKNKLVEARDSANNAYCYGRSI